MTTRVRRTKTAGAGPGPSSFRPLTRRDLTAFDKQATEMILEAIEAGCTGKVSNKGHCILRNSSGDTASISRSLSALNRGSQNARAQMRRLLDGQETPPAASSPKTPPTTETISVSKALQIHAAAFSSWMDTQKDGVAADARIEVSHAADGSTTFRQLPPAADDTTQEEPAMAETTTPAATPETSDAQQTLQRIREALGEDPRLSELSAEIERLRTELDRETEAHAETRQRAETAESRIALLKETLGV